MLLYCVRKHEKKTILHFKIKVMLKRCIFRINFFSLLGQNLTTTSRKQQVIKYLYRIFLSICSANLFFIAFLKNVPQRYIISRFEKIKNLFFEKLFYQFTIVLIMSKRFE
ncbi:hypothetical protein EDEG_00897 [Edhazardia aedis USNM 41457]|uniref:Transmembrane protein n=1 Tax=Edhazardia aedis (strain USNM 41457) TaxID=1003232 RepID=J9DBY3_EDHAE|nr:hypothetical protein EDEG_00897 [Edhazardia aedis USNM 41457]|eukprot:EJW05004.1 hypothetical protein EDEG_00897 [Edhazardia aedis USNM 41457]